MAATGDVVVRTLLDTGGGAGRGGLVRRLVEMPAGARFTGAAGAAGASGASGASGAGGELWFVIAGVGRVTPGTGPSLVIERDTAVWLPPGARYDLVADGPEALRLDSVCLPAGGATGADGTVGADGTAAGGGVRVSRFEDCPVEVTGDRQFRVLFGPGNGCAAATLFVGEIPPGRAPEHSHTYDEVVLILDGEGLLHAGPAGRPLAAGSCVHLRPGQPHCLENTGQAMLRVLGVFHPGGSPAAKRLRG